VAINEILGICKEDPTDSGTDLVEALPLLECISSTPLVLFVVPVEHSWRVVQADCFTKRLDDTFWVIKEVVSINQTDVNVVVLAFDSTVDSIDLVVLAMKFRANLATLAQKIEHLAELDVASLIGVELAEACDIVQRWNRASIPGWDA
jgi:hypothetical protein